MRGAEAAQAAGGDLGPEAPGWIKPTALQAAGDPQGAVSWDRADPGNGHGPCANSPVRLEVPACTAVARRARPSPPVAYAPRGANPRPKGAKTWSGGRVEDREIGLYTLF